MFVMFVCVVAGPHVCLFEYGSGGVARLLGGADSTPKTSDVPCHADASEHVSRNPGSV